MFMLLSNGPSKIPESEPIVGSRGRMEPRQLFSEVIHGLHSQVDPVSFRKDQLHKNHLIRRHNYKQMSSDVKLISFQPSHIKPNSSFTGESTRLSTEHVSFHIHHKGASSHYCNEKVYGSEALALPRGGAIKALCWLTSTVHTHTHMHTQHTYRGGAIK
eukprot:1146762-Pelagomonas_calceolata.AAC.3